jgi:NAD(P)-dependent dehydrogenase (short-subunit alcohol dehydrogenase family)
MQPKTNPRLAGRVVLVTGAAKAIGRAICLRLAAEGAHIGCADLDAHGTASTAREIGSTAIGHCLRCHRRRIGAQRCRANSPCLWRHPPIDQQCSGAVGFRNGRRSRPR